MNIESKNNSNIDVIVTIVTNITITLVGVATGIIAARLLGPSGEGQLAAIQTWPLVISTLAMLGLPESLVYFISKNPAIGRQFTVTAMILAVISVITVNTFAWFALPFLLSSQSIATINAARFFLLIGILYVMFGLPHGTLRGAQLFRSWNTIRILPGLAWLSILLISAIAHYREPIPLSKWFLAGTVVTGLPSLIYTLKTLKGSFRPDFTKIKPMLNFGLPSVTATIPQTINLRFDQILIIALLPPKDLGFYVVAVAWSGGIAPLLSAIGSVLFPKISAELNLEHKISTMKRALQSSTLISITIAAVITAVTPVCIPLIFGNQFSPSIPSALILVPAGAILAWVGVAEEGLRGIGKPKFVLLAEIFAAITTITLLPIFLHLFGIFGAAIASLIAYFLTALICSLSISKSLNIPLSNIVVPNKNTFKILIAESKSFTKRLSKNKIK